MSEWQTVRLGDIIANFDSLRVPVKGTNRNQGLYPYYGASGIVDYVDEYIFDGEYLLIAEDGENLRSRKTPVAFMAKGKFWVNNHAHIVKGNEKADTRFLLYVLSVTDISGYVTGSAIPKLSQSSLNAILLRIPPIQEQKRIAHILSTLDDKIELNRRMNATLEELARTLFKAWFVDFEPFGGTMPEDWRVGTLGEVADINARSIGKDYPFGEIEYIDIASVSEGQLTNTTPYTLKVAPGRARRIVKHGDTIWSMVRPNRRSFRFIHQPAPNLIVSTGFAVLSPREVVPSYLYAWTTTQDFTDYLVSNADGSAYPAVPAERFANADILVPAKDIQDEFERIVGSFRDKIAANEKENRTLEELRDALLPKLLSGELSGC